MATTDTTTSSATKGSAHIVAIRREGVIEGHQLRINGGGTGQSKYFASGKFGGPEKAKKAALKAAKDMGLPKAGKRGGSVAGRLLRTSTTQAAGIRFVWTQGAKAGLLRITSTWTDKKGKPHHTSFSVDRNGLEGALDAALAKRVSCGAPMPDREALLKRLKRVKKAGPPAAA